MPQADAEQEGHVRPPAEHTAPPGSGGGCREDGVKSHPTSSSRTPSRPQCSLPPQLPLPCRGLSLARPSEVQQVLPVSVGMICHQSRDRFKPQTHPSNSPARPAHLKLAQGDAQPKRGAEQVAGRQGTREVPVPAAQGGFSTAGRGAPLKIRPVDKWGDHTNKFKGLPKAHNVYYSYIWPNNSL